MPKKIIKTKTIIEAMEALKITPRKGSNYLSREDQEINDTVDGAIKIFKKYSKQNMSKEELIEEILDIINSENSGLSHQQRLNEIENLLNQNKDE